MVIIIKYCLLLLGVFRQMIMIDKDTKTLTTDFKQSFLAEVKALFLQEQEENLESYLYSTPNPEIEGDLAICYIVSLDQG